MGRTTRQRQTQRRSVTLFGARAAATCALALSLVAQPCAAQDLTNLGGDLTDPTLPLWTVLELPAPNIRSRDAYEYHLGGHQLFHGSFESTLLNGKPVIGPFFNHSSCGGCHIKDGRGPISFSRGLSFSAMLVKVSRPGLGENGAPTNVPGLPEQLQDHTITGRTRFNISLRWEKVRGKYGDGTPYVLRKPLLTFDLPQAKGKKVVTSLRMTPPVIGMGLLEAVPDATIIAMSDPNDLNQDGISGRVSYVPNRQSNTTAVGRFGFRASHPTIRQQSAAAFFNDMGMTNELFSSPDQQQEVSSADMDQVVFYQQAAGVMSARNQDDPDIMAGKELFKQMNCQGCHVMTLQTGASDVVEVANQEFHPFTDLLLHDMGRDLSDKRPEFEASGREWRTTPLWGLGLHEHLSTHNPGYLHDGRARTITEAILWHGGEAAASRRAFKALTKAEREQLIAFLMSL